MSEPNTPAEAALPGAAPRGRLATVFSSRGVQGTLLVLLLAALVAPALELGGGVQALHTRYGALVALLLVPLQALLSVTPFPSQIVALPMAFLFGFGVGAALIWLGWMLTAALQYKLARRAAEDLDFEAARARLPRWLRELPAHHPAFLIITRWLPGGSHVVNGAAGAYRVSFARHLGCAAVSIVPRALFFSGIANGVRLF